MPSVGKGLRKLTTRRGDSYNPHPSRIIVSDTRVSLVSDYRSKTVTTRNVGKRGQKMSVELLYEKARKELGATPEERLRKARARTIVMTKILASQAKAQAVDSKMLARTCSL
ncbi:hypothetical protein C1X89_11165 [Pseudomonas sp. GP01-A8]|jgi:hypothetical protein|nr:hypothetical protein C1X90_10430 [Pseudomonas sp. GP01-A9]PMU29705.1 hypothetical protein C1X88_12175 [Pseudomonas sp. GP01-A13]PMU40812.1 hypothetical protein C1X89_11165 [Pseudomonas sp. GP01-A8]PMU49529.1 hypothetical protein C1X87_17140 [Pseudomonas sp. GP01-A14]PMU54185.1 hypothetical protein C1X85_13400 [Pseudomonas sp. GP01-A6]PMU60083.1 hypothetical protein C1X86_25085 [Pseudomonas sp. GP01-A3]PMU75279.1 hypothetical protein C1X81_11150 [Pseudomonas sp. FW215-L2]PMU75680.1 hypothe